MNKFLLNLSIALSAVAANKLRSVLTALGIIFGVASVIAMMAVGRGNEQEVLDQFELIGVNNIIVKPTWEDKQVVEDDLDDENSLRYSDGLCLNDLNGLSEVIPTVNRISPEIELETRIVRGARGANGKLIGVGNDYFPLNNFNLSQGRFFSEMQLRRGEQVCLIGSTIQRKFFPGENPIGGQIKCGRVWLKVIGVLEERTISKSAMDNLGIRDYNADIYVPVQTVLLRFQNRALITSAMLERTRMMESEGVGESQAPLNYHQLDKLTVQVKETAYLRSTAEVLSRYLQRKHRGEIDYEIQIPELQLQQQQETKERFGTVLFLIAAISLLVGGIGIMNIMLASVLERIKEIGLRLSVGATKEDIVWQFLLESVLISLSGGIIGIILGLVVSEGISSVLDILTIVTPSSIIVSFFISVTVGIIFGILPARRAARQDPIKSLRYET